MEKAELARFIDRWTMEYVRVYPHPIERVWRAIVDPEEFGVWFIKGRLEPRPGGRFWFGDDGFQGAVQAIEPPRLLRLGDDNGESFQYTLTRVAGGTRMQFLHRIPPRGPGSEIPDPGGSGEATFDFGGDLPGGLDTPWRPGFVGGFHGMFDELTDFLDGVPGGSRLPPTRLGAIAQGWARYASGLDLTAEQKSRIAHGLRLRER